MIAALAAASFVAYAELTGSVDPGSAAAEQRRIPKSRRC